MSLLFQSDRRFVLWRQEGRRARLLLRGVGVDEQEDLWFDGVVYVELVAELEGLEIQMASRAEAKRHERKLRASERKGVLFFHLISGGRSFVVAASGAWVERVSISPDHPAYLAEDYGELREDEDFCKNHVRSRRLLSPTG
jgi:hypothetical protein